MPTKDHFDKLKFVEHFGVTDQTGSNRVNRGGSWNNDAVNCRSANRNNNTPDNRNDDLGFRLVSTLRRRWEVVYGSLSCASGQVHGRRPAPEFPAKKQHDTACGKVRLEARGVELRKLSP